MNQYPYVFHDQDKTSHTFGLWCIRWDESFSEDGFTTREDALKAMEEGETV